MTLVLASTESPTLKYLPGRPGWAVRDHAGTQRDGETLTAYSTSLSAVLKHAVTCRKSWKIAPLSIVIDLWGCGVCVCACVCTHNSGRCDCLHFKGVIDFHPNVWRNLEAKYGYINKMHHF